MRKEKEGGLFKAQIARGLEVTRINICRPFDYFYLYLYIIGGGSRNPTAMGAHL
jgi:hypothetical protein